MARKVSLYRRPALPQRYIAGTILRPSAGAYAAYQREWVALLEEVWKEARPVILEDIKPLLEQRERQGTFAMDADEPTNAPLPAALLPGLSMLIHRLQARFYLAAQGMAERMLARVNRSATSNVNRSLKEMSEGLSVSPTFTPEIEAKIRAGIDANVRLIRDIPEKFIGQLSRDVQDAMLKGNGWADIQVKMAERYGTQTSWYKNVAMDQVNKAYMVINEVRMRDAGIKRVEWVHRPIAREPRHHHELSYKEGGLNGLVFDLDDPPIIDPKTGERGLPGQLPFCHCIMRPVIDV